LQRQDGKLCLPLSPACLVILLLQSFFYESLLDSRHYTKFAMASSYWLSKELLTEAYQNAPWDNNDLISHYSDIFIAFALLDERINGNVPVSEGILIVRDYRGANQ
jgi:hypothetical protein